MERHWDLIVVGGGPAGVLAGWIAARAGLRVALLDHKVHAQIGDKVCGDALIVKHLLRTLPPTFAQALVPRPDEIKDVIDRVELDVPSGKKLHLRLKHFPLVTVDRLSYGQRLLADAQAAGVQIFDQHTVSHALLEKDRVTGVCARDRAGGKQVIFRAPLVVDASGVSGAVRRSLPAGFAPLLARDLVRPGEVGVTFREIWRTPQPHGLEHTIVIVYPRNIPPPGYLWYFSRGERVLNVGIGYRDSTVPAGTRPRELFHQALRLDGRLEHAQVIDSRGGTLPARRSLDTNVAAGLLIAGDAAFHADPLSGEGHGAALLAGYWAGETAVAAHQHGDFSEAGLWAYNGKCMAHFGQTFAARSLWSRALEQFTGADFDFLHAVIQAQKIAELYDQNDFIERAAFAPVLLAGLVWRMWRARHIPSRGFIPRFLRVLVQAQFIRRHYAQYPHRPQRLAHWAQKTDRLMELQW